MIVRYMRCCQGHKAAKAAVVPEDLSLLPTHGVAAFVARVASAHGLVYHRSGLDDFAEAVTRAAGDDLKLDVTGALLVALKKKHLINGRQFARLLTNHVKELKRVRSDAQTDA